MMMMVMVMVMMLADLSGKKKKHVRFARMNEEEEDDNPEQEEEEEDTLFDKRKDVKAGLKSALKRGKKLVHSAAGEKVEIKRGGGACGRWMITLTLCSSFLGLGMCISVLLGFIGNVYLCGTCISVLGFIENVYLCVGFYRERVSLCWVL
ncbi:sodium-dependent glucose transporter 1 [Pangasianodon hypophthalmus]|uniref:sodium-dependent glucose transporter 1 n=1 Tax=Pangasianodon hypophthalmus TaxID=310915 RepID=UPI0023078D74|nr:sodium-dependent glucose transporter 1 [Pangasianodon hypophthalmus]